MLATQALSENPHNKPPVKMERRDSTTSESSLEQLDLGRTPKKLKLQQKHVATALHSTPNIVENGGHHNNCDSGNDDETELLMTNNTTNSNKNDSNCNTTSSSSNSDNNISSNNKNINNSSHNTIDKSDDKINDEDDNNSSPITMESKSTAVAENNLITKTATATKTEKMTEDTKEDTIIANNNNNNNRINNKRKYSSRLQQQQQRNNDSDEAGDYDDTDEESSDGGGGGGGDKQSSSLAISTTPQRIQRHYKKRSSGRLDKRTVAPCVQLEYNADNPNSLRKKFRFNRSSNNNSNSDKRHTLLSDTTTNSQTNNESGFVDATNCSSQLLNASAASSTNTAPASATTPQHQHSSSSYNNATAANSAASRSSSAASSPRGAGASGAASVSSPESGIGEREDMKFVCPICDVVSATPHEFTNHIRCHNYTSGFNENFTCRICSKVLSSASSLDRHVLVHTGERPFNCKYCHLTFTTNGNMHRHMRTHKQHQQTHHRRNSNANKNHNNSNNSSNNNNNNNNSNNSTVTPAANSNASSAINNNNSNNNNSNSNNNNNHFNDFKNIYTNAQLSNGNNNVITEGAKTTTTTTAAAMVAAAAANSLLKTTTATKSGIQDAIQHIRQLNGRLNVESALSCESDGGDGDGDGGGCSTDDSTQSSKQKHNNNNNNNNNNYDNNSNSSNNLNNDFKRKIQQKHYKEKNNDADVVNVNNVTANNDNAELALMMKRRVKTTINNNIINAASDDDRLYGDGTKYEHEIQGGGDAKILTPNDVIENTQQHEQQQQHQQLAEKSSSVEQPILICPVCNADDFDNMLSLSAHMDSSHADIPAKCRHCDVVFRTHQQLNVHPCTQKSVAAQPDLMGFNEKFSLLAKSLMLQQQIKCSDELEAHLRDVFGPEAAKLFKASTERCEPATAVHTDDETCENQRSSDEAFRSAEALQRNAFFQNLYLQSKARNKAMAGAENQDSTLENPLNISMTSTSSVFNDDEQLGSIKSEPDCEQSELHNLSSRQSHDSKDLADIQSILNMTSSSSTSNFLKNFEQSVNTPSSNYGMDKDEEEAQDAFTSEFRKMKLRGEFPCKLCTAVFPNLRALKGHNRIHLSAAGPAGPFRCNMCPYSICDKAALVRHMRTHNGDRPYECSECNYAFTTKANCERHLRNRHNKTTREEVKLSIIYHPSEDSSCDDVNKKLHMFSSSEFDDENDFLPVYQQHPKDRSTPVSHLKEMLTGESPNSKPVKIQVKSLEQLLDKGNNANTSSQSEVSLSENQNKSLEAAAPIDLSMDVLDLSKKATKEADVAPATNAALPSTLPAPIGNNLNAALNPVFNPFMASLDSMKNIPGAGGAMNTDFLGLAQQMYDPNDEQAKLLQFYRNIWLSPLNPFFLQNSMEEVQKLMPFMNQLLMPQSQPPLTTLGENKSNAETTANFNATIHANNNPASMLPTTNHVANKMDSVPNFLSPHTASPSNMIGANPNHLSQMPLKPLFSPMNLPSSTLNITKSSQMPSAVVLPGGPVKMVIKNGVLMPKQKQRRYRTERPFTCEHCSARFTLRSNMERHIKQQHPQYYAQRQRSGHHIMRGRGASSSAGSMNSITHFQAAMAQAAQANGNMASGLSGTPSTISEQVKYAILAQQLKVHNNSDLLQQALSHGSSHLLMNSTRNGLSPLPAGANAAHFNFNNLNGLNASGGLEDDEPKLIIDEDDNMDDEDNDEDMEDDDDDVEEVPLDVNPEIEIVELNKDDMDSDDEAMPTSEDAEIAKTKASKISEISNEAAKKVAATILEQAIKAGQITNANNKSEVPIPTASSTLKSMIAQAESVGKSLKDVASSSFKDESQDLVPVSKLVDNATSNLMSFNNYFRPSSNNNNDNKGNTTSNATTTNSNNNNNNNNISDIVNHMEQSDEEGLVASGSASESNNSGTEDVVTAVEQPKKKSAYSLAPNRVSCPYCQRMFPWSSSLRRHILTHTGQKPFKCSHCPLLFTTKSNCDRHLMRKHGGVESAMSVYVPSEDVTEPIPVPKSVEEIEAEKRREEEERRRKAEEAQKERERLEKEKQEQQYLKQLIAAQANIQNNNSSNANPQLINPLVLPNGNKTEIGAISSSDLPYKCHLCESSFGERWQCMDHIKSAHTQEFNLLIAKGAIENETEANLNEDEERKNSSLCSEDGFGGGRSSGRYPDYSNRKVICAFCLRRFWSTEDLRRHMRTHSGERPFQCEICLRKFTLKHSMLRHMKKHNGHSHSAANISDANNAGNSGSDFSDDEQTSNVTSTNVMARSASPSLSTTTATASIAMTATTTTPTASNVQNSSLANAMSLRTAPKIQELLNKANEWRTSRLSSSEQKESNSDEQSAATQQQQQQLNAIANQTDLIGNLLGISDQGILNKLLSSPDEAAKLLGVEK